MMKYLGKKLITGNILMFTVLCLFSMPNFAASFTYDLKRTSTLTNVDDTEGRWQFSGGKVYLGRSHVGYFVSKKRISFGASAVNKAALETTVIWKTGAHNLTLQGTHYFGNGAQSGAVSAASSGFSYLKNATVSGTHKKLTFTY